jgi:hypothetical protein
MLEIFVFGTLWFWLLSLAAVVTIISFVELGYPGRATTTVVAFLALLHFFGGGLLNALQWISANPGMSIGVFLLYFVAGTAYCVTKWYFFLLNKRDEYRTKKEINKNYRTVSVPPKPSEYRSELVGWIIYWPFSGLWTLINDPVKRIAQSIYMQIEVLLQRISDNVFRNESVKKEK